MTEQLVSSPPAPPPQQFSSADGTVQGAMDGLNSVFTLSVRLRRMRVFRNGILMTLGLDCVTGLSSIVFLAGQIPQPGDIVTVSGYVL